MCKQFGSPELHCGPLPWVSGVLLPNAKWHTLALSFPLPTHSRHKLHVIMDEVYMLSVFEESLGYRSVLSLER